MFLGRGLALGGGDRGLFLRGGQSKQQRFDAIMSALGCELLLHLRESSGNPINSGSAPLTIAANNIAQGVAGQLAANDAYTWNGTTSDIQVTNGVGSFFRSLASQGWVIAVKPTGAGAGENNSARLINFGASNNYIGFDDSSRILFAQIQAGTTNATVKTTTTIGTGAYTVIFLNFDNTGDRLIHIYIGTAGGVAEAAYSVPTPPVAAVGTITSQTQTLYIGNRSSNDRTVAGDIDFAAQRSSIWTTQEMAAITAAFLAA